MPYMPIVEVNVDNEKELIVSGNTFPIKDKLKSLCFQWDPENRCWFKEARDNQLRDADASILSSFIQKCKDKGIFKRKKRPYGSSEQPCKRFKTEEEEEKPKKTELAMFPEKIEDTKAPEEKELSHLACLICLTNVSNTIVEPCNHVCFCGSCALEVVGKSETPFVSCPICKQQATKIRYIYRC